MASEQEESPERPPSGSAGADAGSMMMRSKTFAHGIANSAVGSAVLDSSIPMVELESDRLTEAMTWVYDAIRALQRQGTDLRANVGRLDGTLRAMAEGADDGLGGTGDATPKSGLGGDGAELLRHMRREEQRRIACEKMLEMRIDSLRQDVATRLQPKDLESFQASLTERVDASDAKLRDHVGTLNDVLREETASERRRLWQQVEALSAKITSQFELEENMLKATIEKTKEELQQLDGRLAALESQPSSLAIEQIVTAAPAQHDAPLQDGMQSAVQEEVLRRLDSLEAAAALSSAPPAPDTTAADSGSDVANQLCQIHLEHTKFHHGLLELGRRLGQVESSMGAHPPPKSAEDTCDAAVEDSASQAVVQEDLVSQAALQDVLSAVQELRDGLASIEERHVQDNATSKNDIAKQRRSIDIVVKYVTGANPADEEDRLNCGDGEGLDSAHPSTNSTPSGNPKRGDPLAWLEKRVHAIMEQRDKGLSLESRVRKLEKMGDTEPGGGMDARLKTMEATIKKMDLQQISQVKPRLDEFRHDQVLLSEELHREMKEVKCIVGCLESCVPRETRKAIGLFKRAAGANDEAAISPLDFELEGKILSLHEEMEKRLKHSEDTVADQCRHVHEIMRLLERNQDMLAQRVGQGGASELLTAPRASTPGVSSALGSAGGRHPRVPGALAAVRPGSPPELREKRRKSSEPQVLPLPPGWKENAAAKAPS